MKINENNYTIKKISFYVTLIIMVFILCSGTLMHIMID